MYFACILLVVGVTFAFDSTPPVKTHAPQRRGCFYQGKQYANGETVSKVCGGNWCYGLLCTDGGLVIWDDWRTTKGTPTRLPTTPSHTEDFLYSQSGCTYKGKHYSPNDIITTKYDAQYDWCHGLFCNSDSSLAIWDTQNCKKGK